MVDELNWDVEHGDQKSTIQVGSFRIDSKGNQGLHEVLQNWSVDVFITWWGLTAVLALIDKARTHKCEPWTYKVEGKAKCKSSQFLKVALE